METIKIIDLVNKIANNEKIPTCHYKGFCIETYNDVDTIFLTGVASMNYSLNDEVVIVEYDKEKEEIEELEYCEIGDDTLDGLVKSINELNKEFVTAINGLSKVVKGLKGKSE